MQIVQLKSKFANISTTDPARCVEGALATRTARAVSHQARVSLDRRAVAPLTFEAILIGNFTKHRVEILAQTPSLNTVCSELPASDSPTA